VQSDFSNLTLRDAETEFELGLLALPLVLDLLVQVLPVLLIVEGGWTVVAPERKPLGSEHEITSARHPKREQRTEDQLPIAADSEEIFRERFEGRCLYKFSVEDDAEAVRWYRLAAEQGQADAQSNLGYMYATGAGVPEDDVVAYMWYNLAAAQQGNENAQRSKDILEDRMTREQIAEAQRLSTEWIAAHPPGGN
jgi:hypothetical protein